MSTHWLYLIYWNRNLLLLVGYKNYHKLTNVCNNINQIQTHNCHYSAHTAELISTISHFRSSISEVLLEKGVLYICSKFTGEHPCRSVISGNFIEITLWRGYSPVNLLHIFRTPFAKNTSERLLLSFPLASP